MFPKEDVILCNLIQKVEKELSEMNTGYKTGAKCALFETLIHIMRKYEYTVKEPVSRQSSRAVMQLREAMNYINENLNRKLTLKEIADKAYLTETYFSSLFKKYNGISPWDYVMIKRVEVAIEMLKTTSLTKLEIAERCGFESSSNFYKAFAKVTGKTPSEYTKKQG
jgi:xylan 1,4-beta-xylosidase